MSDRHKNFAYSTVTGTTSANSANPGTTGIYITVGNGQGPLFPDPPFNVTVWPTGVQPVSTNAEIVRVIDRNADTFTCLDSGGNRAPQEGSSSRNIVVGDQLAATITAKTLTDAEGAVSTYAPYVLASGAASSVQTLNNGTGSTGTGSLFMFPVTIGQNLQFNQLILGNSLNFVSSANTASNTYVSKYGIYSMNANTLSLISSNSFSIGETLRSVSATWNYPTTTHTSGYGYGNFPAGNLTALAQRSSYITGMRAIGLQFGGDVTISGGVYWVGLLSLRSTASNGGHGISHSGVIGHIIQNYNQAGTVSGGMPIGYANSQWSNSTSNVTGWWGRHIVGFVTATSITNFLGTAIPTAVTLSALGGHATNSTATILPTVTFVYT